LAWSNQLSSPHDGTLVIRRARSRNRYRGCNGALVDRLCDHHAVTDDCHPYAIAVAVAIATAAGLEVFFAIAH
jgi:hypothetical protein